MKKTRKITNLIAPILKRYRYRNKPDAMELFQTLRKNEIIPKATQGNVLVLPIRVAPVSNLFEGIYSYALKLRGYNVHALLCNQFLNKCDNMTEMTNSPFACSLCKYEQKRFSETFLIFDHDYDSLINEEYKTKIRNLVSSTKSTALFNLKYDDVLLGHHIKSAVMRYLLTSDVEIDKYENLIREYALSTLFSYEATRQLLLKLKPKFVISSHGVYSTWGAALEACKKLNIEVIVWGRGYISGNIIISRNESYLYERVFEPTKYWKDIELSNENKKQLRTYFLEKKNPNSSVDHVNYYKNLKNSTKNVNELLGLDSNRLKFALFPNIPWDGTTFSSSKAFPTMELFFQTTIDWFKKNPEFDLIIRAHPAELKHKGLETIKDLLYTIYDELPSNVYFLDANHEVTSYDIEKISDACLMYASTMALELAYFGKTVIQAGQSNVSNKGIIFEADSIEKYESLLDQASKKSLVMTGDMLELIEKYAYHWLYKRHIPENTYSHKALTFTKYNINNSMELAPGKNRVIDFFIDRCEDGKPFIWEHDA